MSRISCGFGITEQNLSLLKSGKVRGIRFATLARICEYLQCQPGDLLEFRVDEGPADAGRSRWRRQAAVIGAPCRRTAHQCAAGL